MSRQRQLEDVLMKAQSGEADAQLRLVEIVYEELRIMAHRHLRREYGDLTLSTTALVNEAFLKLFSAHEPPFRGRSYFFGAAARAMRQVILDLARARKSLKHGGEHRRVTIEIDNLSVDATADRMIELDQALDALAQIDGRLSSVVECRFFGGLTEEETSKVVGVTPRTVRRDWRKARAWLHDHLAQSPAIT